MTERKRTFKCVNSIPSASFEIRQNKGNPKPRIVAVPFLHLLPLCSLRKYSSFLCFHQRDQLVLFKKRNYFCCKWCPNASFEKTLSKESPQATLTPISVRFNTGFLVYNTGLSPGYAGLNPDLSRLCYEDAILKTGSIYSSTSRRRYLHQAFAVIVRHEAISLFILVPVIVRHETISLLVTL